ncbi:HupE/UreJ family protein [Acidimangrovimonas pyrenivorans]|uniref:HupE/UreJ family protein n=1 Tax=Acidimangrovimonas pyrenivorans TaxID=2030798 RepID=A0ABV7AKD1_9RHOB
MKKIPLLALALAVTASPALAHIAPLAHGSVAAGLEHPVTGPDHVLAMVAVGLWAAMAGGRALWALPATFVGAMVAGYGLALAGVALPMVEPMILASVILLGGMLAFAARLPLGASVAMIAAFGLAHGAAHGAEVGGAGQVAFGLGFALATAALHGIGVGVAQSLVRLTSAERRMTVLRGMGAATAAAGLVLAFS